MRIGKSYCATATFPSRNSLEELIGWLVLIKSVPVTSTWQQSDDTSWPICFPALKCTINNTTISRNSDGDGVLRFCRQIRLFYALSCHHNQMTNCIFVIVVVIFVFAFVVDLLTCLSSDKWTWQSPMKKKTQTDSQTHTLTFRESSW